MITSCAILTVLEWLSLSNLNFKLDLGDVLLFTSVKRENGYTDEESVRSDESNDQKIKTAVILVNSRFAHHFPASFRFPVSRDVPVGLRHMMTGGAELWESQLSDGLYRNASPRNGEAVEGWLLCRREDGSVRLSQRETFKQAD